MKRIATLVTLLCSATLLAGAQSTKSATPAATPATAPAASSSTSMPTRAKPHHKHPVAMAGSKAMNMAPVNVNTATAAELAKVPGVSPKVAENIVKNRPYKTVADLVKKVKGIGKKNILKMEAFFTF